MLLPTVTVSVNHRLGTSLGERDEGEEVPARILDLDGRTGLASAVDPHAVVGTCDVHGRATRADKKGEREKGARKKSHFAPPLVGDFTRTQEICISRKVMM